MLTIEMLRQNSLLSVLTDQQLSAIAEMSQNDENAVIGSRIGALHGQYDSDILSITGISKKDGEKSYDYTKRVLNEYKSQISGAATLHAQLANAKTEVENLKQKIAEGNVDDTVKQQLKDAKTQVAQLQKQLTDKESEFTKVKSELEGQIKAVHVDYAFQNATAGLKFKSGIAESLQNILLSAAKAEVLAKGTPDFITDAAGNKTLIFRDQAGNVLNNPANNLNPYTTQELLMQTSLKDAIDTGRQLAGVETKPIIQRTGASSVVDLSGVRTQVEADRAIEGYLLAQGITRDSEDFGIKLLELRNENNVSQLPIR